MSKQFPFNTYYSIGQLKNSSIVNAQLLAMFEQADSEDLKQISSYYSDQIDKLDYFKSKDFERTWTKYFYPLLSNYLDEEALQRNMKDWAVHDIWFQQYETNGTHGWHVHDCNFTAVYYVELPYNAPKTELILDGCVTTVDVNEGDLLIFPSFISHRAPRNTSEKRKTIVSFNLNFYTPIGINCPIT
jgi:hypothetical protein